MAQRFDVSETQLVSIDVDTPIVAVYVLHTVIEPGGDR
jgi:hypothetical protein